MDEQKTIVILVLIVFVGFAILAAVFEYGNIQDARLQEQARVSVDCELTGVDFDEDSASSFSFTVRCKMPGNGQ